MFLVLNNSLIGFSYNILLCNFTKLTSYKLHAMDFSFIILHRIE